MPAGTPSPRDLADGELFDEVFVKPGVPLMRRMVLMARGWQTGSPWAMLGKAFGVAVCDQPKTSVYSDLTAAAPLNLLIGFVGVSGMGKGLTMGAPLAPMSQRPPPSTGPVVGGAPINTVGTTIRFAHPASGEQLVTEFFDTVADPSDPSGKSMVARQHDDPVWADWPEIDAMAAKMRVSAATLEAFLRSVFSGESFGDKSLGRAKMGLGQVVAPRSYRCVVTVGVQPSRAAALIRDGGGGTVQRYLFLPVDDPEALDVDDLLPARQQLCRSMGAPIPNDRSTPPPRLYIPGPAAVEVSPEVMDHISATRASVLRQDGMVDPEDTHRINLQTRVAAILGGWAGPPGGKVVIDDDLWWWSGCVMERARRTRLEIVAAADAADADEARRSGRLRHISSLSEAEAAELSESVFRKEVLRHVHGIVSRQPGAHRRTLHGLLSVKKRRVLNTVLADGVDAGVLLESDKCYYPGGVQP